MTTYFSGFKIKGLRLKHNLQALEVATALRYHAYLPFL